MISLGTEGVTLTFTGRGRTETTGSKTDGTYSYQVPYRWTGRVIPSKGDLLFYPPYIEYGFPGVTRNMENQDYQLIVSLDLKVARGQDSTLIIRKEYGELELNVDIIENSSARVQRFIILRKEPGGSFQEIATFYSNNQNNERFTYIDENIDTGKKYIYIARARNDKDKIIGESKEKII